MYWHLLLKAGMTSSISFFDISFGVIDRERLLAAILARISSGVRVNGP